MQVLISALYFVIVLSVLVVAHEWGHYIVAKLCKMRVDDFSLFFGPRLVCLGKRNGTEYNIRSVPLGGFVKIAGMEPDDVSAGTSIVGRGVGRARSVAGRNRFDKTLHGLSEEAIEGIDFDQISERVLQAVNQAIGPDGRLTDNGKEELNALLVSMAINPEEQRYLEAILSAGQHKPDPDAYNQKPLWQRAAVIAAGPFMSLFFGYLIFCVMGFTSGLPDLTESNVPAIIEPLPNKVAARAGLQAEDRIVAIDGKQISNWQSMAQIVQSSAGKPIHVTVLRHGATLVFTLTPEAVVEDGKKIGRIGIQRMAMAGMVWRRYPPMEAVKRGTQIIYLDVTVALQGLFSRHVGDNVGGIISIAGQIHEDAQQGPRQVLFTAALLSVSLGIMNLFPIPVLDGGHLMLLAVEGIRRRKLSSREVYAAQMVGLSIIAVLFLLVTYKDILRYVGHGK